MQDEAATLTIKTLGGLSIELNGRPLTTLASRKAEALFIYLACNPREHPRELLADLLWDDRTQRRAMSNLRVVLSSLRQETGPFVTITRKTAAINPTSNLTLDARRLETALPPDGIKSDPQAQQVEQALTHYNGDFLAGYFLPEAAEFESWSVTHREHLHRLFLDASLQLGRWWLNHHQYPAAIAAATHLVQIDPLAEAGHRQLMEALARSNQRAESLAQYGRLCQILAQELGLEPEPETQSLHDTIRTGSLPEKEPIEPEQPATRPTVPQNLTPLLGRETELEDIQRLINSHYSLITITGPGGIGKTSLALELAHQLAGTFQDGAAFVNLAPLQTAEGIIPTIAQSLHFTFQSSQRETKEQLLDYLREKSLLVVLDNFEHLLDSAPLINEIIDSAPRVKLLVTSRERLKLQTEQTYPLQGLALSKWETVDQALQDPAVLLFLECGRRIRPNFELQDRDLNPLRQLFQLVQGLPLAIILAAAWLELLDPAEIAAEIQQSLDFLEADYHDLPERQRSIKAIFNTSWAYLNQTEQKLLAILSIFRGGFTLEAAKEIGNASLQTLLGLTNRSLLTRKENGRFECHELLRQFSAEQLAQSPMEETAIRDRHSRYYLALLEKTEFELKGASAQTALQIIQDNIDNIYEGWNWAVAQQKFTLLGSALFSLTNYWTRSGRFEEGLGIISRTVDRLKRHSSQIQDLDPSDTLTLVRFIGYQCQLQNKIGLLESSIVKGQEALSILEKPELVRTDHRFEMALVLSQIGWASFWLDRNEESQKLLKKSISLFESLGDSWELARAYNHLAGTYIKYANSKEVDKYLRKSLKLFEELKDKRWIARTKGGLGLNLGLFGECDESEKRQKESIAFFQEIGDHEYEANTTTHLSLSYLWCGRFKEALATAEDSANKHQRLGKTGRQAQSLEQWCWAGMHLGKYEAVLEQFPFVLKLTQQVNQLMATAMTQYAAGCAWLGQGQTNEARALLEKSANNLRDIDSLDYLCLALSALCSVVITEGDLVQAEKIIHETKAIALKMESKIEKAVTIAPAALLLVNKGQAEQAVELYALACQVPYVGNSRWFEDIIGRPINVASTGLPPETIAAARKRGRKLDLIQTTKFLLQDLQSENTFIAPPPLKPTPTAQPHQSRFIQERLIATGGFGEVYRGRDTSTDQIIIIKKLKQELVEGQPHLLARFIQEGELLRQLNHPNIVQILASQEINGRHCLIMEYVPGGSLYNLLNKQIQLPLSQALDIALELADALTRAHHLDIIHRDLKPANVLLAEDGTPRLTDFGLARFIQRPDTKLTPTGTSMGTLTYMSPEAFDGETLDGRTDVWAFGVMLFEMLAGEPPFQGPQMASLIAAILNQPPPDLTQIRPDVPPDLAQLINQMLIKNREDRIGRMRQVAAHLDQIRSSTSPN